jgi:DNA-binding transcriptional regulator YhcF (GntR family)
MVGANREAVTRAFSRLQDEGIVELRRRLIYIPDAETLRRAAEEHGFAQEGQTP